MSKSVGLDVGYGFVKVFDGEVGFSFPSVVGAESKESYVRKRVNKISSLDDLMVSFNGKKHFVGKSAIKHSQFTFRDQSLLRNDSLYFQILFFTALSLYCSNPINTFNIVTGLPVNHMSYVDTLTDLIGKGAKITRYLDNEVKVLDIQVNQIEIVPQPLGTYYSEFLNKWGKELKPLEGMVGVVDVGYRTTDLITVQNGEYISEKSKTFNVGMTTVMNEIINGLRDAFGLELESYRLNEIVANKKITASGELQDVSQIVDEALQKLASSVLSNIYSFMPVVAYDSILLSGGGCQSIASYILPKIKQGALVSDPVSSNCIGYLNWANRYWENNGPVLSNEDDA